MIPPVRPARSLLALALLAAFGSAGAQPVVEGSIAIGAGAISGDRDDLQQYNQYNGLKPRGTSVLLFGADYYRRDDAKGEAFQLVGADLGTANREIGLRWLRPGNWKLGFELRELARNETVATVPETDLKVRRTAVGVEVSKVLDSRWQLDGSLRSEKKEGSRLWGTGFSCPSPFAPGCAGTTGIATGFAVLFAPEPISARHSQAEARLSYTNEKLRVSAGYYGSFYRNDFSSMRPTVPGLLNNAVGTPLPPSAGLQALLSQPVALPPDNQAHHFDLSGSYGFSTTTVLNFKLAHSIATQDQSFAGAGFASAPAGVTDLGGKVNTTMAQVGFASRPAPKLSLSGHLRYEQKDDETPVALYNVEGTSTYTNRLLPRKDIRAKAQASYQFTGDLRGTLGATFDSIDRGVFTATSAVAGITALRQKTEETGLRAEVRRRMSEDLSGALSLERSRRNGSNWLADNSGTGVTEVTDPTAAATGFATGIFMPTLADRQRDKVRFLADWQPSESVTLQAAVDTGRDTFDTPSVYGLRRASMQSASVDATYAINDKWNVTGFISHGRQSFNQARPLAAVMAFEDTTNTLGIGFTGKPASNVEVGGSVSFIDDHSVYAQTLDGVASPGSAELLAATGGLPDIVFRQVTLKLFGKYTLDKVSSVRFDVAWQRTRSNDWAWGYNTTPFVYSDGTTLVRKPLQSVTFVGVQYIRKWQ